MDLFKRRVNRRKKGGKIPYAVCKIGNLTYNLRNGNFTLQAGVKRKEERNIF